MTEPKEHIDQKSEELSARKIRSLIFYLLYAMEAQQYENSLQGVIDNFNREFKMNISFDSSIATAAQQIIDSKDSLDDKIKPLLRNWRFDRLGMCTKLILRFALWELHNTDIEPSIIINEAIELAKCFAEKDAYKFINGILDEEVKSMKEK